MRIRLLKVLYVCTYYLGINRLFYLIKRAQRIIAFHNVIPDPYFDNALHLGMSCKTSTFEKQIQHILKRLKISTVLFEKNTAMITFDDGYDNNSRVAIPVLSQNNIKAYFFVPINNIDSIDPLWIDKVLLWFSYVPDGKYLINGKTVVISNEGDRRVAFSDCYEEMYADYTTKNALIETLGQVFPFASLNVDRTFYQLRFQGLSIQALTEMKKAGHKIGAHSVDHDILSLLPLETLMDDFRQCKQNSLYNTLIYAYPFGGKEEVNHQVIECCKNSGFINALMNCETVNLGEYSVPRISLGHEENLYRLDAILCGLESTLKRIGL